MRLSRLADELETSLFRDLIDRWYPRTVAPEGGFHQSFDQDWQMGSDSTRFLVFQSRLTWVAATLAEAYPDRRIEMERYARHGVRFLLDKHMDRETGSLIWWLGADGKPCGPWPTQRRVYGTAFGLFALAAVARSLQDEEALLAAIKTFNWLEKYAHDPVHGGYREVTEADGSPVVAPSQPMPEFTKDPTNNPYGLKSHNTQLHILEALAELCRVWPDPLLKERISEMLNVLGHRFICPTGCSVSALNADLTHATDRCSFGHDIEAAHLILDAAKHVGEDLNKTAFGQGEFLLAHGRDHVNGGFWYAGETCGLAKVKDKAWWVLPEAMLGYTTLYANSGDSRYLEAAEHAWECIKAHHIDHELGGWYGELDETWQVTDGGAKAYAWKACYHETRGLLYTARILRHLHSEGVKAR